MILEMEVLSIIRFIIIRFLGFKFEANQIRSSRIIRSGNRKAEFLFIPKPKVKHYFLSLFTFHSRRLGLDRVRLTLII